jgi:hypothetical protein
MKPIPVWSSLAALGLSAAMLAVVGCHSGRGPSGGPGDGGGGESAPAATAGADAPADDRLLANFPEKDFAGALVFTGQMAGYLEPCGCSAKQKGGLVRRMAFLETLRKQGWDLVALDLGSLADEPGHDRGGPEQEKLKFDASLKALLAMGYAGVALSTDDMRYPMSAMELLMQFDKFAQAKTPLLVLAANVKPAEGLGFEQWVRPSLRTEVGPIQVGVTAVLDPAEFQKLNDDSKSVVLTVGSPEESLPAVLADLEKDTNVQVLMVQGPPELAAKLAQQYPGFEIVVGTSQFPDPPKDPVWLNDHQTMLVTVGKKGMYLGVVGLYRDKAQPFRYQRVELNDRYDELRDRAKPMVELIDDELQNTYKDLNVLASFPKRPYALFDVPADATYVGAEACKSCHPGTYAKWSQTRHAHAYEVLVEDPHQPGRNREHDASCVSCHTTGFEYLGGFTSKETTPHLMNNQCENCHGPGSKHASEPDDAGYRKSVARDAAFFKDNPNFGCVRCHDDENDTDFDFDTMYPKIMHKGLDTYDDPKVHRGLDLSASPKGE